MLSAGVVRPAWRDSTSFEVGKPYRVEKGTPATVERVRYLACKNRLLFSRS